MLAVTKVKAFLSKHVFRKKKTPVKNGDAVELQKSSSTLLDFDSTHMLYLPVASPIIVKDTLGEMAKKGDDEKAVDDEQYLQRPRISFEEYVKGLGIEFAHRH